MDEAKGPPAGAAGVRASDAKYSAELSSGPEGPLVRFRGTISTPNPGAVLIPFVDAVHAALLEGGHASVVVDFQELEFCNSAGFKAFLHWIQRIEGAEAAARYRLRFCSSPGRKWQRTSLLALSCFSPSRVELQ